MNVRHSLLVTALVMGLGGPSLAAEPDPKLLVEKVDTLRRPALPNLKMEFTLTTVEKQDKATYAYSALIRQDAGALVMAKDGDQRGQKYLYTPTGYWLYAPRTRRPLRLTPLQSLRGQASIGDVSRLNFSEDYTARLATPSTTSVGGRTCTVLSLTAKSKEATYATVTLLVDSEKGLPVRAELMSASGRKLKTLEFGAPEQMAGSPLITTLTYVDGVDASKQTIQKIQSVSVSDVAAVRFQPQALSMDE